MKGGAFTLRDLAGSAPAFYADIWNVKSDEEKRKSVQHLVTKLAMNFSPDPLVLIWLLEQAGVIVPESTPRDVLDVECPECCCEFQMERDDLLADHFAECPECGHEVGAKDLAE